MSELLASIFWGGAATILYVYAGYPLAVWLRVRARGPAAGMAPGAMQRRAAAAPFAGSVSVVLPVHDEAERLVVRLDELTAQLAACGGSAELIVVTDGCSDGSASLARAHPSRLVRVIELVSKVGKASALTSGCAAAKGEILVFADARQRWAPDALARLTANFTRPEVGAASGELMLERAGGVLGGVGLYWRYEKWLRNNEGLLHSTVGVTGAICAVRRELFVPLPPGLLLDDLYWPLAVVMRGYRVVHDTQALAYDRLPGDPRGEFRRKVRTLSGNFQLLALLPRALVPWANPLWLQFVSHKLLRLVVPWLLIALLLTSALLPGGIYRAAFWAQAGCYALAAWGLAGASGPPSRVASAAAAFVVLNAAAWLAFWVWITGSTGGTWKKARYGQAPGHAG